MKVIHFNVSDKMAEQIDKKINQLGLVSRSEYIRNVIAKDLQEVDNK